MKLKNLLVIALGLISSTLAFAQESEKVDTLNVLDQRLTTVEDAVFSLKKLKISGYIQAQWQSSQLDSALNKSNDMKSGTGIYGAEKAGVKDYNRFGVRRGRLKATYEDFGCQAVVEFDISEGNGTTYLKTKDLYLNVLDPWINTVALKGGVFDRPFGYEVAYSSSKLESPERSRIIQNLFPDEKDLGTMLTIQAPKTSPWNVLKLEAGLLSGNSINKDYKSKKDLAAHLTYSNSTPILKYGIGVSMYAGSILQTDTNVYVMKDGAFSRNIGTQPNKSTARTYFGVDGQFSISSDLGLSSIRAEYITGTQPGSAGSSASPNGFDPTAASFVAFPTYIRKFQGGYINFVQDIADTKHSIVVKYDWYDPNTAIKGASIGTMPAGLTGTNAKTGKADVAYSTLGLGYMYRMNNNVRLMVYYDMVSNEKVPTYSASLKGFTKDLADNLVTVRLQYKF